MSKWVILGLVMLAVSGCDAQAQQIDVGRLNSVTMIVMTQRAGDAAFEVSVDRLALAQVRALDGTAHACRFESANDAVEVLGTGILTGGVWVMTGCVGAAAETEVTVYSYDWLLEELDQ